MNISVTKLKCKKCKTHILNQPDNLEVAINTCKNKDECPIPQLVEFMARMEAKKENVPKELPALLKPRSIQQLENEQKKNHPELYSVTVDLTTRTFEVVVDDIVCIVVDKRGNRSEKRIQE